jgi:hypothetical protein
MRSLRRLVLALPLPLLLACAGRSPYPSVSEDGLELHSVVLYRNGVGYFERVGVVDGELLRLRVRKDQVNDLLKSLTVVDENGQAVSVSMPLDPQTWANLAMSTLAPGRGSLAQILDSLRGHEVSVAAGGRILRGRITMIEHIVNEPDPELSTRGTQMMPIANSQDWKLTLMNGSRMHVVRLSRISGLTVHDGDLAMQLHRALDASAGEGMFEQVDVEVRLASARRHRLTVSYVVGAPMWKPTYRVVLPEAGKQGTSKGTALLQGWAVVDNVSGEDWREIELSLTSGAPIAFRYDLHTPREVWRSDLTQSGVDKQATVSLGETSWEMEEQVAPPPPPMPAAEPMPMDGAYDYEADMVGGYGDYGGYAESAAAPPASKSAGGPGGGGGRLERGRWDKSEDIASTTTGSTIDVDSLRRSTLASTRSQRISGLTRVDLTVPVTVPDGTSTMVALVNEQVEAEETFLYKPGGAGYGYEANPYRVVRFKNTTDYVLEPGPIAIYSGGSFVGEGLSEAVGANTSVTIPFAVETEVLVTSSTQYAGQEMKLTRIVRGVLEVESFYQSTTTYDVRGPAKDASYKVLVRHPRAGSNYELAKRPEGTEDLDGAWLVPITIPAKGTSASLSLVEQTPSNLTLAIWDSQAPELLTKFLEAGNLDAAARKKLQPIVDLRREIGKIDTEVDGLRRQQGELHERADQTRRNLEAIEKDPAAKDLRSKLNKRLEEFSSDADALGRKIVELESKRLEKKIELEDLLQDIDLRAPATPGAPLTK